MIKEFESGENPRILRVGTDVADPPIPRWWRRLEERLKLDICFALRAKLAEKGYDIIWAEAENVGILLSFLKPQKPLVVIAHHLESPFKRWIIKATGISKRWAGIGYISNECKKFCINDLGITTDRLFRHESAKYLDCAKLPELSWDGPIVCAGVAKRDYSTLIRALADLPGYETELFISSKFEDRLEGRIRGIVPDWVKFMPFVPEEELIRHYRCARFFVVPLKKTTHSGAGTNSVLEAGAFYKAVIATRTGGMETFIRDGKTGILVEPHDVKAMRAAIKKLWSQPDLSHQMGFNNRSYVEATFNPAVINSSIRQFIDTVFVESVSN